MATRKKRPAYRKVTLTIDHEQHAFATREGAAFGHFGAEDFLNGILSTAITEAMAALDDPYSAEVRQLRRRNAMQEMRIQVLKDLLLQVMTGNCEMARQIRELHFGPDPQADRQPGPCDPSGDFDDGIPF